MRGLLPRAHFACLYAKPAGKPLVDTFVAEVPPEHVDPVPVGHRAAVLRAPGQAGSGVVKRRSLLATALAAAALPAAAAPGLDTLARVRSSGVVRIGAVAAQPPYSWIEPATGAWAGFMVDIAQDFAATLGAKIQPVESTWGNAVLDIQADKVDIFFGLAPTPQRALAVDFTRPLYDNAFALIARPGFAPASWAELNRPEVRIAIERGTVYDQNIEKLAPQASILRLPNNNAAALAVQTGHADCQVIVVILAITSLAKNPALGHLVVPGPVFASPTAAITPKQASPAWREAADAWIAGRRQAGWLRAKLVENLEKQGARAGDVPSQLLF